MAESYKMGVNSAQGVRDGGEGNVPAVNYTLDAAGIPSGIYGEGLAMYFKNIAY